MKTKFTFAVIFCVLASILGYLYITENKEFEKEVSRFETLGPGIISSIESHPAQKLDGYMKPIMVTFLYDEKNHTQEVESLYDIFDLSRIFSKESSCYLIVDTKGQIKSFLTSELPTSKDLVKIIDYDKSSISDMYKFLMGICLIFAILLFSGAFKLF